MIEDVRIPEISENVTSGKVVAVLVAVGDIIAADDFIIEFETEKAVVEIPSPVSGKITELLASEGAEMKVGDVIIRVDTEAQDSDEKPSAAAVETPSRETSPEPEEREKTDATAEKSLDSTASVPKKAPEPKTQEVKPAAAPAHMEETAAPDRSPAPASPSVRRFARELGVDIQRVQPTGPGGRITEADVKAYVKAGMTSGRVSGTAALDAASRAEADLPDFSRWGEIETEALTAVRRLTGESTGTSWRLIPHVTQFDKADITDLNRFIEMNARKAEKAGTKLTVTAVLMKICAEALTKFPRFNASIDPQNDRLILKKYVHMGMAVDTPRGLLVPVIRNAETKSILELAAEIVDLAVRARNKKVKPDEMEGGTFTISNQGGIGGTQFTPIVLWPQAAILGVSRSAVEPRLIGSEFRPRTILPLSLSYDHRIIDGADAARFMRWICDSLEQPLNMFLE